jgi:uncharacterized RDD family membrane protein YckC
MVTPRSAGFWIRAVALVIDLVIIALVQSSLALMGRRLTGSEVEDLWPVPTAVVLFTLVFTAAYTTVLHGLDGQTLGKLIVGVRVVGDDGAPPGVGTAFLRYLGYYASLATFGLGFIMAGLRRDKRALHDLLAGTRVERTRLARARPLPGPPRSAPDDARPGPLNPPLSHPVG